MRTRSEDRKAVILQAAADLFRERGYSGAGIDDIGAKVGISGPAVYRYFPGKEAMLAEIVERLFDELSEACAAAVAASDDSADKLELLITATVSVCLSRRAELAVCLRHLGHLGPAARDATRRRLADLRSLWLPPMQQIRPERSAEQMQLFVRVCAGIMNSTVTRPGLPRARLSARIASMVAASLHVELVEPIPDEEEPAPARSAWERSSRREEILTRAIALFREHGFRGVSIGEIGEAAGVSGSAIYRHFRNKEDLLTAAVLRYGEQVALAVGDALAKADGAQDALDRLLRSYVSIAVANSDLIAVAVSESHHLPADARRERRRNQRMFLDEWTHTLTQVRPELPEAEARVAVHATIGLVTEVVRSRCLLRRPALDTDLHALARAVLLAS